MGHHIAKLPTSNAAWGWKMTPPAGAAFTCKGKAEVGCVGMGQPGWEDCDDATFECEVEPNASYSCDVNMTVLKCSTDGGEAFQPKSGGSCINLGYGNHTKDSELLWH